MGKMNTITKDYMSEPKYFADSFNYYLFDGKQVIQSDNLQVLDPTEMALIPEDTTVENVEKIRDALNYGKQVSDRAKEHRKKKDLHDSGEFLSGFSKKDKLKPLITLTIYFGPKGWDAPRSLKEMFETTDETILQFVEDYRVHLIVPKEIQDFNKFATDFGKALKYIAVSEDKSAVEKLQNDEEFQNVDVKTVQLLNECTNSNIPINKGEEETNMDMCRGLKELLEDKQNEGEQKGIKLTKKVYELNRAGKSKEAIAKECGIPVSRVEEILA